MKLTKRILLPFILLLTFTNNLLSQASPPRVGSTARIYGGTPGSFTHVGTVIIVAFDVNGKTVRTNSNTISKTTLKRSFFRSVRLFSKSREKSINAFALTPLGTQLVTRSSVIRTSITPLVLRTCSAARIADKLILTAMHCFNDYTSNMVFFIYTGKDLYKAVARLKTALPVNVRDFQPLAQILWVGNTGGNNQPFSGALTIAQALVGLDLAIGRTYTSLPSTVPSSLYAQYLPRFMTEAPYLTVSSGIYGAGLPTPGIPQIAYIDLPAYIYTSNPYLISFSSSAVYLGRGDSGGGLEATLDEPNPDGTFGSPQRRGIYGVASFTENLGGGLSSSNFTKVHIHKNWINLVVRYFS